MIKELLELVSGFLGSRVVAGVVVALCIYYAAVGLLRFLTLLQERTLNTTNLSAMKTRFEILKIAYEIKVIKIANNLQELPLESELSLQLENVTARRHKQDVITSLWETVTETLRGWFSKSKIGKAMGYVLLYLTHFLLRFCASGLLVLIALVGGVSKIEIVWEHVIPLSVALAFGFLLSHYMIRAARRAGLREYLGSWSYAAGVFLGFVLYASDLYPSVF